MPRHGIADFHGVRRANSIGTPMAFDDHAVKAKEYSAIDIAWIHPGLQRREGMARQKIADPRHKITAERFATILRDLVGRSFRGLQGDITGEAFGDHGVDRSLADVVAFDKAAVVEIWEA